MKIKGQGKVASQPVAIRRAVAEQNHADAVSILEYVGSDVF